MTLDNPSPLKTAVEDKPTDSQSILTGSVLLLFPDSSYKICRSHWNRQCASLWYLKYYLRNSYARSQDKSEGAALHFTADPCVCLIKIIFFFWFCPLHIMINLVSQGAPERNYMLSLWGGTLYNLRHLMANIHLAALSENNKTFNYWRYNFCPVTWLPSKGLRRYVYPWKWSSEMVNQ